MELWAERKRGLFMKLAVELPLLIFILASQKTAAPVEFCPNFETNQKIPKSHFSQP